MNQELPDVQAEFREGRGTRDQIDNIRWIIEKTRDFQKNICCCFIDYAKAFDSVDHNKLWKILGRDRNTRPSDLPPEKSVCRSRSNRTNTEQQTGSKLGKEYAKAVLLSPCLFNLNAEYIMQNTRLDESQKLESRLPGEISITLDMQMTPQLWKKAKRN